MAKKKTNGLSIAIVALNIIIVGVIILLVVLVYLHMKEDTDNGRGESTSTSQSSPEDVSEDTSDSADGSSVSTTPGVSPIPTYNRSFFANDLFIGDSIATGLYDYSFLDKANVFAEVGLNPESVLTKEVDGMTCAGKVSAMQPRNIYIMLGSNGLAFLDGSYMSTKIVELIAQLEAACPTAKIYIITIPPVTAEREAAGNETMEKINSYNTLLRNICSEGGYGCIDLCPLLQDENGYLSSRYAEVDGLHFLSDAYLTMLSYVEQCAG